MITLLPKNLVALANILPETLYVVGGACRDFLIDGTLSKDIDLCSPITVMDLLPYLNDGEFNVIRFDEDLGYVKFRDNIAEYEFTSFRSEEYEFGGKHKPKSSAFTLDITLDAKRRDFKCNAIYYDIKKHEFTDPLDGIKDIKDRVLSTTRNPEKVLSEDGERLLRLARFSGELGFKIEKETFESAKRNAKNVSDISKPRIYKELNKMLHADDSHAFSPKDGHFVALVNLEKMRVLDYILPELALGRDMEQRKDYHDYDVLYHTLKSVLYSDRSIRLATLLHDIGKPYCKENFNSYCNHNLYGKKIAKRIMEEFCISKKEQERVCFLIENHMIDLDLKTGEKKARVFIVKNYEYMEDLYKIKLADYKGCKDGKEQTTPFEEKWRKITEKMKKEGCPFLIKDMDIESEELVKIGFEKKEIADVKEKLFFLAVEGRVENKKESLIMEAKRLKKRKTIN